MWGKEHIYRASLTLIDQGVVSLGTFLVNISLARQLAPAEYGTFALLMGGLYGLQIINSSLIFYPMSVRLAVAHPDEYNALAGVSILVVAAILVPLCASLALILLAFDLGHLVAAALAYFTVWQFQEGMRRGLLARFRIKAVIVSDTISYFGQFAAVVAISMAGTLSLPHVFFGMAIAAGLALCIQLTQLQLALPNPLRLREILIDFWSIGSWSLANNLISHLRVQSFPWLLAFVSGAAAAASFQAVLNILNLANPVIIGLCNIIPQIAARAAAAGRRHAWSSSRIYMYLGALPIAGYYCLVLIFPEFVLRVFYGSASAYVDLSLPLRILVVAFIASYGVEMICSFLHGIDSARLALVINAVGLAAAAVLVFPLTGMLGLTGSCIALAAANGIRLIASQVVIARAIADKPGGQGSAVSA